MDSAKFVFFQVRSHLGRPGFGYAKKIILALHPHHPPVVQVASRDESWRDVMTKAWEAAGRPQVHTLLAPLLGSALAPEIEADFVFQSKKLLSVNMESVRELQTAQAWLQDWQQRQRDLLCFQNPELGAALLDPESSDQRLAAWLESRGNTDGLFDLDWPVFQIAWSERHRRKKILVHVCCGPDAVGVFEQLRHDFDLIGFWYDPNIQPRSEYDLRLSAFVKAARALQIPYVIGDYDEDLFMERIEGLQWSPEQGAKCTQCYDLRLERAALEAQKQKCDVFTSTLAISPHKVQEKLARLGQKHGGKSGVPYLARNYMKEDGFKSATVAANELGLYRQDYCGCYFSLHEGGMRAQAKAKELGFWPPSTHPTATESARKESVT